MKERIATEERDRSIIVQGEIMTVQAFVYPEHRGYLFCDVPVLLVVGLSSRFELLKKMRMETVTK